MSTRQAKSTLPSAIVITAFLFQFSFAALPRYTIIDLGTLDGDDSSADFISNNGGIVGYSENSLFHDRAVLFDPTVKSNITDLGTLGGNESSASSINTSRQIVGVASDSKGRIRATLFDATGSGNNTDLGTLGGRLSGVFSINEMSLIVGYANNTSDDWRAVLFDPTGNGNNIDLGTLGGNKSEALSINDSGQIVGWAETRCSTYPFCSVHYLATLFDASGNGRNINLGTLPGGWDHSRAHSINNNGQIVGMAFNGSAYIISAARAALFFPGGDKNPIDLGTLGGDTSYAFCINDKGQIVGSSGGHAALFDPSGNGNNIDLNTLIDPNSGWILEEARSINEQGWIVGRGYYKPIGETHAILMTPVPPKIIYVDDDAEGASDGSSWTNAFNYLQDALSAAWSGDEIRVAQGTYKPDQGAGITPGDREATFQLINGVMLKGGYAGLDQPDPNARDIELYATILSGDLVGNDRDINDPQDFLNDPCRAENSYHVATASGTDSTAILDGFTITSGNASLSNYNYRGGGMLNEDGSPTVTNCRFTENSAEDWGGGMCNTYYSSPTLTNCTFGRNSSRGYGGGMLNFLHSDPTLINCIFVGNSAFIGGGIHNDSGSPTLANCVFSGNSANYIGGGIYNEAASAPILTNCTFSGNSGVAIFIEGSTTVTNCIFWGNTDNNGTGEPAQFRFYADYSTININYSCVQGWTGDLGGTGNIGANPYFVDLGYWDANGAWIDGDYHLLSDSPCINAGDPNYITGPNETDLDGKSRVIGGRIDMGAYEYSPPILAEARIVPRTINLASEGRSITCYIQLPEGYNVADIDPNSVLLEKQIKAEQLLLNEQQQVATAKFIREDVQAILVAGQVELTIIGRLTDGTIFEATDVISVLNKSAGKSPK